MNALRMSTMIRMAVATTVIGVSLIVAQAEAVGFGRTAARGLSRGLFRRSAVSRSRAGLLRRDLVRDRAAQVSPLARQRTVFRYTSKARARTELRKGIPTGRHMTAFGGPGRPLSPMTARTRYGLLRRPSVRETIRLPKGQPVRFTKTIGGRPGVGELTSSKRLPFGTITRVVPLGGPR